MDSFLTAVEEFVEDECQTVTCKRLCQHLSVSVRQSQDILGSYIESCVKQKKNIQVSYLLTGRSADGIVVQLVTDRNLDNFKSKLQQVLNKSLYSVQKGGVIDSAVFYNADLDLNNSHQLTQFSGIEYKNAKKLDKKSLKIRATSDGNEQASDLEKQFAKSKNPSKSKRNFFKKQPESVKKIEVTQKTTKSEAKKSNQKKSGLSGYLTKTNKDPFDQSGQEFNTKVTGNPKIDENPKIQIPKIAENAPAEEQLLKDDNDMKIDDFSDGDDFDAVVKPDIATKSKPKTAVKKEAKKRKRIEWLSSSSDDDDDVAIPSPKKTLEKIPSPMKTTEKSPMKENNKQMKRVLKTRTFVDDEGCMVTEKSYELEECDQPEEVVKDKKTAAPQIAKKKVLSTAAQPKKQKQASIMGFFKRK